MTHECAKRSLAFRKPAVAAASRRPARADGPKVGLDGPAKASAASTVNPLPSIEPHRASSSLYVEASRPWLSGVSAERSRLPALWGRVSAQNCARTCPCVTPLDFLCPPPLRPPAPISNMEGWISIKESPIRGPNSPPGSLHESYVHERLKSSSTFRTCRISYGCRPTVIHSR